MISDLGGENTNYLVNLIMGLADLDGDGHTDFEEFLAAASVIPDRKGC